MPTIKLTTTINAPRERVFDLARSIDAHMASTSKSKEIAIAGVTTGRIGMGEEVTWQASHFGVKQRLKVQITEFDRPAFFTDEMIFGAFKSMRHTHRFEESNGGTHMIDELEFKAPLMILGRIAESQNLYFLQGICGLSSSNATELQAAARKCGGFCLGIGQISTLNPVLVNHDLSKTYGDCQLWQNSGFGCAYPGGDQTPPPFRSHRCPNLSNSL